MFVCRHKPYLKILDKTQKLVRDIHSFSVSDEEIFFIILTNSINVAKLVSSSLTEGQNKLVCLSLAIGYAQ